MHKLGLYIHWPYCISKCPYCDFNSHVLERYDPEEWLKAYMNQIAYFKKFLETQDFLDFELKSIFFGGGTPSLMEIKLIDKILSFIFKVFKVNSNTEITLETNPTNLEVKKINDFKSVGVNRISLGVQGLNDKDLKFLGRLHSSEDVIKILDQIQKDIENISVDLIYALDSQDLKIWKKELQFFLKRFSIKHLSAYQLVIEKGTKFYDLYKKGLLKTSSDDLYNKFYNATKFILNEHDFKQYEISNYSKPDFQSQHNKIYWESENWIGIGPGAIGRLWSKKNERIEIENFKKPKTWLKKCLNEEIDLKNNYKIKTDIAEREILIMGLRLNNGIELDKIKNKNFLSKHQIVNLFKNKVIAISDNKLRINESYFNVHNYILKKIIDNY